MAAALVVTSASVSEPFAAATPQTKNYTATESPSPIHVGRATPVTVTLTNSAASNQTFASAELTIGSLPASAVAIGTNSAGWSATFASTNPAVVLLKSGSLPGIAPGGNLTLNLTVTPPTAASIPVGTVVKQSNDFSGTGNNFNLQGPEPVIAVIPVTLAFDQQPTDVQQSVPNKSSFSYMCPAVSVLVTAGTTPVAGISVTLNSTPSPAPDPGLYFATTKVAASGVSAVSDASGVATFGSCTSGLAATNLGSGFTLTASSLSAGGAITSDPFSVVQFAEICGTPSCNTPNLTSPATGTTGSVAATFGTPGYKLEGSFAQGGLTCDSSVTTTPGDPFMVQTSVGASGIITMTFPKAVVNSLANNGTPLMQVCAGASEPFPGSNPNALPVNPPFQGLLQDCPTNFMTAPGFQLCVVSRAKHAASETIQVFASDLSDPHFW